MTIEPDIRFVADVPLMSGTVNGENPWHIPVDAASELLNIDTEDASQPRRREGYVEVESRGVGLPSASDVRSIGYLDIATHSRLMVLGLENDGLYYIARPSSLAGWTRATTSADTSLNSGLEGLRMFQSDDLLWCIGPGGGVHALAASGELIDAGNALTSPPWSPVDGCFVGQRVLLIRNGLYWSKLSPTADEVRDSEAFDRTNNGNTGGGYLSISSTFGRQEVAIRPWIGNAVIVYYDRAIMSIAVNNSDPSLSAVEVVEPQFGCCGKFAIATMGAEQFFADQDANVRSLGLTIQNEQRGVIPEALSERVKKEIPGSVTVGRYDRIRFEIHKKWLWVFYPRNGSQNINACMRMHLQRRTWDGPWVFAHEFSGLLRSNVDGDLRLYGVTPDGKLMRMFDGRYSDDGEAIEYRETARSFHFDMPWCGKRPMWVEVEFDGDAGAEAQIFLRTEDDADWTRVKRKVVTSTGDFPLYELGEADSQFPITEGQSPLPLTEITSSQTRGSITIHQGDVDSGFPAYGSDFGKSQAGFPRLGGGGGIAAGR